MLAVSLLVLASAGLVALSPSRASASAKATLNGSEIFEQAATSVDSSSIFTQASAYNSGGPFTLGVALGDLNGDGIPDILVANACTGCANGSVGVLLGNGDGTFKPVVTYNSGGAAPLSVAVGDVNGDDKPDVLVVNQCVSPSNCTVGSFAVLLGNGDGTLKAPVVYSLGGTPGYPVSLVDLNGDGKLDLVLQGVENTVSVRLGNGDGTFQPPVLYSTGGLFPNSFAVADMNHDGKLDLVVLNSCSASTGCGSPPLPGTVGILLGNGDGTFQPVVIAASAGSNPFWVAVRDINGDGNPDVVITLANTTTGGLIVLLGNGDGTLRAGSVAPSLGSANARQVSLVDINGDGKLDLLVANLDADSNGFDGNSSLSVLLGNGDGTFQTPTSYVTGGAQARFLAAGDLNADGKPDVVIAQQCAIDLAQCANGSVAVMLGNGDGSFHAARYYNSGGVPGQAIASGDLNGDGKPDLVVANSCEVSFGCSFGVVGVFLSNGDGTFQPGATYPTGAINTTGVSVIDLNGDGKLDVVVSNGCGNASCNGGSVAVFLGNGDGTLQAPTFYGSGGLGASSIAAADVNGDGKIDLVVTNECADSNCANGTVAVLLGNGDGTFKPAVTYSSGAPGASSLALRDLNGDGKLDAIVSNTGCVISSTGATCTNSGSVAVLLGNGNGTFQAAATYSSGGKNATFVAVGDFDGDGNLDVAVANQCDATTDCIHVTSSSVSILLGKGDGTLQPAVVTPTSLIQAGTLAVADFDGDGKLDVACGSNDRGDFLLFGNGDGTFQPTLYLGPLGPASLAADLTGDGKPDLALGGLIVLVNARPPATATALVSSAVPSYQNQPVTFTATVAGHGATPTGSVSFHISLNKSVTVPLVNGVATYNWTFAKTGARTVTARYLGDANNAPSSSNVLAQAVNAPSVTTTTLMSSLNPSMVGQTVTYTATVSSQSGVTATGNITFSISLHKAVVVPLVNGQATYAITYQLAGPRTVSAMYSGDLGHLASTSATLNQTVNRQPTTTILTSSLNPSTVGQMVTFAATVTGQSGVMPTGTVTFAISLNKPVSVALVNGQATFNWTFAMSGPRTVTATYSGDANNLTSVSVVLNQSIN